MAYVSENPNFTEKWKWCF